MMLPDAITAKFSVAPNGCWTWLAYRDSRGYGRISINGRRAQLAHRVIYELIHGPIPDGLELDHLCRNRGCVNPEHVEPVTHQLNMERGDFGMRTTCRRGHPYTPENSYRQKSNGARKCRRCHTDQEIARKRRLRVGA